MPFLESFAWKNDDYHNHYSAGTFTVPGTASLITGVYPMVARAFQLGVRYHPFTGEKSNICNAFLILIHYWICPYSLRFALKPVDKYIDVHITQQHL